MKTALPRGAHVSALFISVFVTVVILVGGVSVLLYPQGTRSGTTTQSIDRIPGGNGVFVNSSSLPTWNATTTNVPDGASYLEYYPSGPPRILLYYDNEPFTGLAGSYCWPPPAWGAPTSCVDRASPAVGSIPTIAVYPSPTVSFYSTFVGGLEGFTVMVYRENPLSRVFSGQVTGDLPLNVTSGNYLIGAYGSFGGADVSAYYNLTVVFGPSVRVDQGISIQLGSPAVHTGSLPVGGGGTMSGVFWEDWPVTVRSNLTTDVYLNATSVTSGTWVEFVPSHLTDVGPTGAEADMLLAGAVRPFVNNDISNETMIIEANGGGGLWGEVLLPIEGTGCVTPVRTASPANVTLTWPPANFLVVQNQTDFNWLTIVYDPGGVPSNGSLKGDFSLVGMVNESQVSGLPSWLNLTLPSPSLTMDAYVPEHLEIAVTASSDAPVGTYAFLLKAVYEGQASFYVIPIMVWPPMYS